MVLVQTGQDPLHDGLSVQCRLGGNLELAAILVYGCQFFLIKIDDLPVGTSERRPLLVKEVGRHGRGFLAVTFQGFACIGQYMQI